MKEGIIDLSTLSRFQSIPLNVSNLEVVIGKPMGTLPGNVASFLSGLETGN